MKTAYLTHPQCSLHRNAANHPEQPARIEHIDKLLRKRGLTDRMREIVPPRASTSQLLRAHSQAHIDRLFALSPERGFAAIDADTAMNPQSLDAALFASGAVVQATDTVLAGETDAAFCNVRPPGHHAERDTAMGFCLFNSIAVGVMHALTQHKLKRVAVIDFDVHHGNGTEDILQGDKRVLMCSTFQWPLYPGRLGAMEPGHMVNVPLEEGADGAELRKAVVQHWLPALAAFKPELIFISAGFDAHRLDPLASLSFTEEDYAWTTEQLAQSMGESPRIVSALEGGYHLEALAASAAAHVEALLES